MSPPNHATLAAYARLYEELSPERLEDMRELLAVDVRFKDPFNDVRGVDAMLRVMAAMFRLGVPHFDVLDRVASGRAGYILWRYTSDRDNPRAWIVRGMTELRFDEEGRITEHVDHWDAAGQIYEKMPLLGGLLRLIRRRMHVD